MWLFLPSPICRSVEKIRELMNDKKFGEAVKYAWERKRYLPYSLSLAREIATSEIAARYWKESVESWKIVCGFPFGTQCNDWLQLAKMQTVTGQYEDASATLRKMKERYPENNPKANALQHRLEKLEAGFARVKRKVLASEPGAYQITYYKNKKPSSTVVITFGLIHSDFTSTPFGFPFITRQGFDHIHVAQERFTFYQLLDLDVFLEAVSGVCQGKNVMAYGSSLAGYAAFYFGGPLGARILAASPRNSADVCLTAVSKHWRQVKWRHGKISDNKKSPHKPVVFWDPMADKRDFIYLEERIRPAYPEIELIAVPMGGHSTFKYLQNKKILKEVFLSVARGEFSADKTTELLDLSNMPAGGSIMPDSDPGDPFS